MFEVLKMAQRRKIRILDILNTHYSEYIKKLTEEDLNEFIDKISKINFYGKKLKEHIGVLFYLYLNKTCKTAVTLSSHEWANSFPVPLKNISKYLFEYSEVFDELCDRQSRGRKMIRDLVDKFIKLKDTDGVLITEKDNLINTMIDLYDKHYDTYFFKVALQPNLTALLYYVIKVKKIITIKTSHNEISKLYNIAELTSRLNYKKLLKILN